MTKQPAGNGNRELIRSLDHLSKSMEVMPKEHDLFFHPGKHLFFTFLKGIVYGLGVLASVAIVVPLMLWLMRGVQWVPLLGDFVARIADQVENVR